MPEPALLRDSEPSIAPVLALFRVAPAPLGSADVLGGHIPALLGAPHCTWYNPGIYFESLTGSRVIANVLDDDPSPKHEHQVKHRQTDNYK